MKCSACRADLTASHAVLITVKVPARVARTRASETGLAVLPAKLNVSVEEILAARGEEEGLECAACGEVFKV
jgi:hypothetical protein